MDQLMLEWQNVEIFLKYVTSFALGMIAFFGYLKQAGIKFATVEKALEYKELKNNFRILQKYLSIYS